MTDSQRTKCHAIIHAAATSAGAAGAGLAQIPLSDAAVITPIQITMIIGIGKVFDKAITKSIAASILASSAATVGGRGISQVLVGWIPGIGNALNASTAFAITEAIGWFAANYFDAENEEIKKQVEIQKSSRSKLIKYVLVIVALIIIALCCFYFLRPASGEESSGIFSKLSLWFYVIPAVLTLAILGPHGILKALKALWKCFKAVAGWIGTIPTIIAGIHLWGNDTIFQKLVKGTVSTIGALLSWLTGYRKGYEKGYQDAQENRQKRWWKVLWPF